MPRFNYGGQALIEGVLMRGRNAIAVAFRHPEGHIVWASESLDKGPHAWRFAKTPFARGLIVLYETLIVGTRWLVRSANIQASAEGIELGRGSIALMLGLTLILGVGIFFLLPLFIATFTTASIQADWVQHTVEGLVRVGLFLGYLALIARVMGAGCAIRRVGSGALGLVDVAAGRSEAYCELHINAWDCAAGILLVQEAGGYTNDFFSGEGLTKGNPLIATNHALCAKLADLIGIPIEG